VVAVSRFSGPAERGASRTLRAVRRAEAEVRQAAADAVRAEREAAYVEPEPLTGEQLDALLMAVLRNDAGRTYGTRWPR
jgi:hypothetical protein